eukprot:6213995-Pleurochrysis_carterae.AAC.3
MLTAPSSSSVFSRVTAFPWEPNRAFCGVKPREPFYYSPPTPFCRSTFLFDPVPFCSGTKRFSSTHLRACSGTSTFQGQLETSSHSPASALDAASIPLRFLVAVDSISLRGLFSSCLPSPS